MLFTYIYNMTENKIELYQRILAMPDFVNIRRSPELCDCGSNLERGRCCYKIPRVPGTTFLDGNLIDENAVVWKSLHPLDEACPRCPHCVGFPCLSKLQKAVNHPALLLVDPKETNEKKRHYTKLFAEMAFTPEMLAKIQPDDDGRYERSSNLMQLSDT
jgi:hypothetical protein